MRSSIIIAIGLVLTTATISLAAEQDKLPSKACEVLKTMNDTIDKAKNEARAKLEKILEEELRKSKNLDVANLIQAKIDELSSAKANVAGKWVSGQTVYEIKPNGKATAGEVQGKWRIEDSTLIIQWNNGFVDSYDLPPKRGQLTGRNQTGRAISITEQK